MDHICQRTEPARVDFTRVREISYWMERFNVTAEELLLAVERARSSDVDKVREALRTR